ncbi:unnamed protein product [Schistosoma margrebowiei]|uniref:Uncharacterized protein n=1 Tax=Schistosoma margrebowiei TaxID=48269 RepID=A0A183MBH0_9TREM|nr:unnamed protein product [Schistosoma margrebowiei]
MGSGGCCKGAKRLGMSANLIRGQPNTCSKYESQLMKSFSLGSCNLCVFI